MSVPTPFEPFQAMTFEAPFTVALGPLWSALASGFAVVIAGQVFITEAGERYLETKEHLL